MYPWSYVHGGTTLNFSICAEKVSVYKRIALQKKSSKLKHFTRKIVYFENYILQNHECNFVAADCDVMGRHGRRLFKRSRNVCVFWQDGASTPIREGTGFNTSVPDRHGCDDVRKQPSRARWDDDFDSLWMQSRVNVFFNSDPVRISGEQFKGFVIQARTLEDETSVGIFEETEEAHHNHCDDVSRSKAD